MPRLEPVGFQDSTPAPEQVERAPKEIMLNVGVSAVTEISPHPAATKETNIQEEEIGAPSDFATPPTAPPLSSIPLSTSTPGAPCPELVEEVPLGLIEDDLLGTDLCDDVLNSLRRAYKPHKKVVEQSRLKSSVLAVKAKGLQQIPALKQELAEKDAVIAELGKQLAAARANDGARAVGDGDQEELAQSQRERDQGLQDYAELR